MNTILYATNDQCRCFAPPSRLEITIISIRYREIRWPSVFSRKTGAIAVLKRSLSNQVPFEKLSCLPIRAGINAFISETIRFTVHCRVRLRMVRADIWSGRQSGTSLSGYRIVHPRITKWGQSEFKCANRDLWICR
jgi:hypothetical protein